MYVNEAGSGASPLSTELILLHEATTHVDAVNVQRSTQLGTGVALDIFGTNAIGMCNMTFEENSGENSERLVSISTAFL